MAGFNPIGSAPVASILSDGGGTFYGPGVGNILLGGVTLAANVSAISVRYAAREALVAPPAATVKYLYVVRETLHSSINTARLNVRFLVREVLVGFSQNAVVSNISIIW